MAKELAVLKLSDLPGLSANATRFARRHPKKARMAIAAALEAAAAQYGPDNPSDAVPASLKPFVSDPADSPDTVGVSDAATRLKVSRTTIYDWVRKKTLLGWKSTKQGLTIPEEQILGPGKVVAGMAQVQDIIGDPELTWAFLSQEWPFADTTMRPIDKLKAGARSEVIDACPGFGTAVT